MAVALQNTAISWDLEPVVSYQARQELECTLSFTAPDAGRYYICGALYTSDLEYMSGTLFGVLLPEGADYAVNSAEYTSLWDMEAVEEKELPCKFTFDRSNVVLGVFLMRMVGAEPSWADEEIGSLSVQLSSPAPPITIEQMMLMAAAVMMIGMVTTIAMKG